MRLVLLATCLAGLAAPAAAQEPQRTPPPTWKARPDDPGASITDLYYVGMPPGWHITSGPAAIYWDPAWTASGNYAVEAEIYQFPTRRVREAFGILLGGRDLEGDGPSYLYFLIRGDGRFLVKRRDGARTANVVAWTAAAAILPRDSGDGTVKNTLRVEVTRERIRLLVNGVEVTVLPREDLPTDGIAGLRINHGLNLHVSRFAIEH